MGRETKLAAGGHPDRVVRGRTGEQAAADFLVERGYRVMARNQRTPLGELDLVCSDGNTIVVVEVKSRHGSRFGTALESIGPLKARRLRGAALWWLSDHGMLRKSIRFDAVVVSLDGAGAPLALQHVRDVIEGGG